MKLFVLLLFAFVGVGCAQEAKCPSTDIKPCECKTYFDGACIITCSLASQDQVDKIAEIPNLCGGNVHFILVHTKISGIPTKLWKTLLSSKTVDVTIKHAGLEALVRPGDEPIPKVYTPGAAVIKVDHAKIDHWDWAPFKQFYSEKELTLVVDDTPLSELDSDFAEIAGGQVHKVTIDSAGLTAIRDEQFSAFEDIQSLSLQNNKLNSVSRSMLAKPAQRLKFLHLNGNFLTSLPNDLFSEMPVLEVVYLRDNQLKSLPQTLFSSMSSTKLQRIDLVNNPWECNCRLMWIFENSKHNANLGVCHSPDSLAGQKIKNLSTLIEC